MCSVYLFYFLLVLRESRKTSPIQKVRNWLMRNEHYLPALTASVTRYVLEPLTRANIDLRMLVAFRRSSNKKKCSCWSLGSCAGRKYLLYTCAH